MSRGLAVVVVCALLVPAAVVRAESVDDLREQVRQAEVAFAKTMADRDHDAFVSFLAEDTVFLSTNRVLRGRNEVAEGWKRLYEGPEAPFSWEPARVEVTDSGDLAISTGPVRDPSGKQVGTFSSTWRRMAGGGWKIVLDNGCPPCACPPE